MTKKKIYVATVFLLVVAWGIWVWSSLQKPLDSVPTAKESPLMSTLIGLTPGSTVEPPPRTSDPEELRRWWETMRQRDRRFEWKMPIEFYGRVIDDQSQPVEGANIRFQWTDLSPHGTSEYTTLSDSEGLFQLSGATGKNLGVQVRKEGYKHYYLGTQFAFEYAAYFEKSFHTPNRNSPVIFRLRRNRKTEPLIKREILLPVEIGAPSTFEMDPKNPDAPKVVFELLTNAQIRDKQWSARISVPLGGLQATLEEFPFEAPESGYETSVFSDYNTPKPVALGGSYEGGVFFVHNPKGYGRVELKMVPGNSYTRVISFWNPSGSRNLE
jgi:hypothetical protein